MISKPYPRLGTPPAPTAHTHRCAHTLVFQNTQEVMGLFLVLAIIAAVIYFSKGSMDLESLRNTEGPYTHRLISKIT